jgi:hypothetical protein
MTRPELIKKLDALLEQLERDKAFGTIEIGVRSGHASHMSITKTERLDTVEN